MSPRVAIDWNDVKRRLRDSQLALERAPERTAAILRERAALLADRRAQAETPADVLRVLVFTLGGQRYALPFADLVELLPLTRLTRVPSAPPAVLGVVTLHDEIRSVVDLTRLMELPAGASEGGQIVL